MTTDCTRANGGVPSATRLRHGPGRWFRALSGLSALLLAFGCGAAEEEADSSSPPGTSESPARSLPDPFTGLQPSEGDVLVPPQVGFRWQVDPAQVDSLAVFRVQLVDSLGAIYGRRTTTETSVRIELPPETDPGSYTWWVELLSRGDSTVVARSRPARFVLR